MEKEEGISRRQFWKRHSCGRCSSFSNGGNLCGNLKFRKELLVVECFEIVVYLFIWSVRDWLGGIISR